MKNILYMTRDLARIPDHPLPEDYHFQFLSQPEEKRQWADIETAANEFQNKIQALERFQNEFQPHLAEVRRRLIFLIAPNGDYAGTATAWSNVYDRQTTGRLHWVAIHPNYQGQKLAKPLITKAMKVLAQYHNKAYLKTQPSNLAAINSYLKLGFQPLLSDEASKHTWHQIYTQLDLKREDHSR